ECVRQGSGIGHLDERRIRNSCEENWLEVYRRSYGSWALLALARDAIPVAANPGPCENCFVGGSFGTFRVRRPPVHYRSVTSTVEGNNAERNHSISDPSRTSAHWSDRRSERRQLRNRIRDS